MAGNSASKPLDGTPNELPCHISYTHLCVPPQSGVGTLNIVVSSQTYIASRG